MGSQCEFLISGDYSKREVPRHPDLSRHPEEVPRHPEEVPRHPERSEGSPSVILKDDGVVVFLLPFSIFFSELRMSCHDLPTHFSAKNR